MSKKKYLCSWEDDKVQAEIEKLQRKEMRSFLKSIMHCMMINKYINVEDY